MMQSDVGKLYICFSQLMVVGRIGVFGVPVIKPVEPVFKSVSETAHNQHLKMAGKIAREMRSR